MSRTIDVALVNPFLAATLDCLAQMAGLTPERLRLFIKTDPTMHGEVTGIIGLSKGLTGSCSLSFPMPMAREIVGIMIGEPPEQVSQEMICDGIGEIANVIAGSAKRQFVADGKHFDISTPTVVLGTQLCVYNPVDVMSIASEFRPRPGAKESFLLEIALRPTQRPELVDPPAPSPAKPT